MAEIGTIKIDAPTPGVTVTVTIRDARGVISFSRSAPATIPVSEMRAKLEEMAPLAIGDAIAAAEGYVADIVQRHAAERLATNG